MKKILLIFIALFLLAGVAWGETLGPELVTNGDMELDSGWLDRNSPSTNERSSEQAHSGTYSRKFVSAAQFDGIRSLGIALKKGSLYEISLWVYGDGTNSVSSRFVPTSGIGTHPNVAIAPANWTRYSHRGISDTDGNYLRDIYIGNDAVGTFYIDDVSVREVLFDTLQGATISGVSVGNVTP